MLTKFFAVTYGTVYRVDLPAHHAFTVTIVRIKGVSRHSLGEKLNGGNMLAIATKLITYTPRDPADPNPTHIGFGNEPWDFTDELVALLEEEKTAFDCLDALTLDQLSRYKHDPQLIESSRRVIAGIEGNPVVYICREAGWTPRCLQERTD